MFTKFFEHKSFLHTVLRLNAVFCGVFGLIFLFFPNATASYFGIPSTLAITITGILLIGWEIFVSITAARSPVSPATAAVIIAGDVAWVLGTIALLMGSWLPLTLAGKWSLAIIGDIVLLFAITQFVGLRKQQKTA